jgi:hypothetical protein
MADRPPPGELEERRARASAPAGGGEAEEPALVVWDADVPLARATSPLADVRAYRFGVDDPAAAFAAVVREKAPGARQVGFDGASRAVPHALGASLGTAIAPARLVDCSALLAEARASSRPSSSTASAVPGSMPRRACARPGSTRARA